MDILRTLFSKRPKLPQDLVLGELIINVLHYQGDVLIQNLPENLCITIPTDYSIKDLRLRVHGLTHIPIQRVRLMFCGEILKDADNVPLDAYESSTKVLEDDDLYRPRIFLSVYPVSIEVAIEEDTKSETSVISDVSEEEINEEHLAELEKVRLEQEALDKAEQDKMEAQMRKAQEIHDAAHARHHKSHTKFKLEKDLEFIRCGHFVEPLRRAGFADAGAFDRVIWGMGSR